MENNTNYLKSIYDFVNSNVEENTENEFEIIDDDYDYDNDVDYEPEWGEEIEIIGDENEEDDFIYELGEGYIPLPQGDNVDVEVLVIDENYVPDEYEKDVCGNYTGYNDEEFVVVDEEKEINDIEEMLNGETSDIDIKQFQNVESEFDNLLNAENCSVIKLPKEQTLAESLNTVDVSNEDKRIAHSIAREHMEKCEAEMQLKSLPGSESEEEEALEAKWIGEDMFGNNIESIIAEDPNVQKVIEDDDFVEGSFEDWAAQQGINVQ